MRKETLRVVGFFALLTLSLFVFLAFLAGNQMVVRGHATEKVAEILGEEWRALEKGDIILKEDGTVYVILGTSTLFNVAAQINVQIRPGSPWCGQNRGVVMASPALQSNISLIRRTDSKYHELKQKFELVN